MSVKAGDVYTAQRTFTIEDVRALVGRAVCTNQHGKEVVKAETNGVILTPREP